MIECPPPNTIRKRSEDVSVKHTISSVKNATKCHGLSIYLHIQSTNKIARFMKTTILLATIMLFGNASCKHANDDIYEQPIPIADSFAPTNVKPQLAPTIMLNNGLTMPVCGLGTYLAQGRSLFQLRLHRAQRRLPPHRLRLHVWQRERTRARRAAGGQRRHLQARRHNSNHQNSSQAPNHRNTTLSCSCRACSTVRSISVKLNWPGEGSIISQ